MSRIMPQCLCILLKISKKSFLIRHRFKFYFAYFCTEFSIILLLQTAVQQKYIFFNICFPLWRYHARPSIFTQSFTSLLMVFLTQTVFSLHSYGIRDLGISFVNPFIATSIHAFIK